MFCLEMCQKIERKCCKIYLESLESENVLKRRFLKRQPLNIYYLPRVRPIIEIIGKNSVKQS